MHARRQGEALMEIALLQQRLSETFSLGWLTMQHLVCMRPRSTVVEQHGRLIHAHGEVLPRGRLNPPIEFNVVPKSIIKDATMLQDARPPSLGCRRGRGAVGDDGEVDVKRNLLVHRREGRGKHLEGRCMESGGDGNGDLP